MQVTAMKREFRFNWVKLPDPNPKLGVEPVREIYATQYPEIATASVNGPEAVGEKLVFRGSIAGVSENREVGGRLMKHTYTVFVDDNFHFMDENERYSHGEFDDCESAIRACKEIVDEFLQHHYQPGMTAQELYSGYTAFGEDPFVSTRDRNCTFSAWKYAKERCTEICRLVPPRVGTKKQT